MLRYSCQEWKGPYHGRREHAMLEKLIKNSIDTNDNYASLYNTAVSLYDTAFAAFDESQANMIVGAYMVAARSLQDALWSEWGLWLKSHNCGIEEFHKALAHVLEEGVKALWEKMAEEEFKKIIERQRAA